MSDRYSQLWWNEQAQAAGGLDKAAVERLTGMAFPVVWNADGTIPWDKVWPKQALLLAPGLGTSGLLLSPSSVPASYPYQTAEQAFAARDPNWYGWAKLVSPVGYVAPGANAPWNPPLSPVYTPALPATNPPATNPPATTNPVTPAPGTVFGIPLETFAIGAGVALVVLLLFAGSPNRRG